jgi:hypothetical protein
MFHVHHVRLGPATPPAASTSKAAAFASRVAEVRRKLPLIDTIMAAPGNKFSEAELEAMSEPDLRKLVSVAASAPQASAQRPYQIEDDFAPVPESVWPMVRRPNPFGRWPVYDDDGDDAAERERAVRAALAACNAAPAPELMPAHLGASDDDDFAPLPASTWTGTRS